MKRITSLILFVIFAGHMRAEAAVCQDKLSDCVEYGPEACKGQYEQWARENCNRFCGYCTNPVPSNLMTPTKPSCHDKLPDCAEYGKQACTGIYTDWARSNCASYCGYCPSLASSCHDLLSDCYQYGKQACVGNYVSWAKYNCAKFCGFCGTTTTTKKPTSLSVSSETCLYKGQTYNKGDTWQDGCAYNCTCVGGGGFYQCTDLCPRFLNLPPACTYVKVPGQCCPKLSCNDSAVPNNVQTGCAYGDKTYQTGETWVDGCKYNCTCINGPTGYYRCRDICPTYTGLPSTCKLVKKQGECCPEVVCNPFNSTMISTTNLTGIQNTLKCQYKGRLYNKGDTWDDGCDYTCTCTTDRGYYVCKSKCITWTLPKECSLQDPAPGKCCKTPKCPAGYTINYPPDYQEV